MDLKLAGRTALITGSYRGTGSGIARVLASEGAHVWVHGFEEDQPDNVVAQITSQGGTATGVVGGLTTDDGVADLAAIVGDVDIVVNNYGAPVGSTWDSTTKWDEAWNVNVMTGVRVAQAFAPAMRRQGWGRIIFVGTIGSRRPGDRNPAYYGAKTALPVLVRSLAMDLRGTGVTANLVSPGTIATSEVREAITRRAARADQGDSWEAAEQWALKHRLPNLTEHIPDPDDIGRVVAFVASEPAWHINGADLPVDGGALDARPQR